MKNKAFFYNIQPFFMVMIIVINLGTFFFVSPLSQNLSDLGNVLGHKSYLILWGTSAALYFLIYTLFFIKKCRYTYRFGIPILLCSCFFMALSVWIPYLPTQLPQLAKWHTRVAMLGTSLFILLIFHIITSCLKTDVLLFQKAFPPFFMLVVFDLLLYLLNGGVSTLLETSFTIGMSMYLFYMLNK